MQALRGDRTHAGTDLQPGRQRRLLGRLRARLADGLIQQIFKYRALTLKTIGADVCRLLAITSILVCCASRPVLAIHNELIIKCPVLTHRQQLVSSPFVLIYAGDNLHLHFKTTCVGDHVGHGFNRLDVTASSTPDIMRIDGSAASTAPRSACASAVRRNKPSSLRCTSLPSALTSFSRPTGATVFGGSPGLSARSCRLPQW